MNDLQYRKPTEAQIKTMRYIRLLGPRVLSELNTTSLRACLKRGWIVKLNGERITYDLTTVGNDVLTAWEDSQ